MQLDVKKKNKDTNATHVKKKEQRYKCDKEKEIPNATQKTQIDQYKYKIKTVKYLCRSLLCKTIVTLFTICVQRIFTRGLDCKRYTYGVRGRGGNSITFGMTLLEMPLGILNAGAIPQHAGPQ